MYTNNSHYFAHILEFLDSDPLPGANYLRVTEWQEFTELGFDTNDSGMIQNLDYLYSLPMTRVYGAVAHKLWEVLDTLGLVQTEELASSSQPVTKRVKCVWTQMNGYRRNPATMARTAELTPNKLDTLGSWLKNQLATASSPSLNNPALFDALSDVHSVLEGYVVQVNYRINEELHDVARFQQSCLCFIANSRQELLSHVGKYAFRDGIEVNFLQESHFQPLQFAGVMVSITEEEEAALNLELFITDSRCENSMLFKNALHYRNFTEKFCLENGFTQLALAPKFRAWVQRHGEPQQDHPDTYWIAAGKLLARLDDGSQVHLSSVPSSQSMVALGDDIDLLF